MRVHCFRHVPYEGPGTVMDWINKHGFSYSETCFYKNSPLPRFDAFDFLLIMGGPMACYEKNLYPWMKDEIGFIAESIKINRKVLGICLGAQLIAEALQANVYKNHSAEIGWFDVYKTQEGVKDKLFGAFPPSFSTMHWHGDTFDIPKGAIKLAYSDITPSQAFKYGDNVYAFQFHPEVDHEFIDSMDNDGTILTESATVQSFEKMKQNAGLCLDNRNWLFEFLNRWCL